jgi:hypothetical protein
MRREALHRKQIIFSLRFICPLCLLRALCAVLLRYVSVVLQPLLTSHVVVCVVHNLCPFVAKTALVFYRDCLILVYFGRLV